MADEGKEGNAVDTSAASLLKHIEEKVVGNLYDEPTPIEDSVKEETPEEDAPEEEPKEEAKPEPEPEEKGKVQKRIDELVGRAKTAEEELSAAKAQIEEFKKGPVKEYVPAPTPDNPLSDVMTIEELRKREQIAEAVRANCIRNPDGYSAMVDGKELYFDASTIKEALVETDRMLRKDIPNRAKWMQEYATWHEHAKNHIPEIFDARTSEYQTRKSMENNFVDIKKLAQYEWVIGLAIVGEKVINERLLAKKKPDKTESKKLPTPPVSASTSSTHTTPPVKTSSPKLTQKSSRADAVSYIMDTVLKNYKE